MVKKKGRKGLISKALRSCRSFGSGGSHRRAEKQSTVPVGCFSVYVGPERERFVVRAEHANHPLFRDLLKQAEVEYGYSSDRPLELPCDVDRFNRVIGEVEEDRKAAAATPPLCGLMRSPPEYDLLSPSKGLGRGR